MFIQRAAFIQTCVMCVFARLLSKNITRASGVNFRALFAYPQTKARIGDAPETADRGEAKHRMPAVGRA
jgi:hypothetical protein